MWPRISRALIPRVPSGVQLRTATEDPEGQDTIRIHLPAMDDRARALQNQPPPPHSGTKHLGVSRTTTDKRLTVTAVTPAYWQITIRNPPINLYDPEMFAPLRCGTRRGRPRHARSRRVHRLAGVCDPIGPFPRD